MCDEEILDFHTEKKKLHPVNSSDLSLQYNTNFLSCPATDNAVKQTVNHTRWQ